MKSPSRSPFPSLSRHLSSLSRLGLALLALSSSSLMMASCAGQKGTLCVAIETPQTDPFAQATNVRIRLIDTSGVAIVDQSVAVVSGAFTTDVNFQPPSGGVTAQVLVEATNAGGLVIARGESPALEIVAQDEVITVWVGPVGKFGTFTQVLSTPTPRTGIAAANIPQLGPALIGGFDPNGNAVKNIDVLNINTGLLVAAVPLPFSRAGATAIGVANSSTIGGLVYVAGGTVDGVNDDVLQEFDPTGSSDAIGAGGWVTAVTDTGASLLRIGAASATLSDGTTLLCGGRAGAPLAPVATATIITTSGSPAVSPTAGSMTVPRSGHTATPISLAGGGGALVFGPSATEAETYSLATRGFSPAPLGVPSRDGATATALPADESGNTGVLILGGSEAGGVALSSGIAVALDGTTLKASAVTAPLSHPRTHHSATLVGDAILVCGGLDDTGATLSDCDVLDAKTFARRTTVPMAAARSDHTALLLETGPVLIAGGLGTANGTIEIYTP